MGIDSLPADPDAKLGVSRSALDGTAPLNGLRHPPEAGTSGWYIWGGEWSDADDFFQPLHHAHVLS